jgi:hypothetical protein
MLGKTSPPFACPFWRQSKKVILQAGTSKKGQRPAGGACSSANCAHRPRQAGSSFKDAKESTARDVRPAWDAGEGTRRITKSARNDASREGCATDPQDKLYLGHLQEKLRQEMEEKLRTQQLEKDMKHEALRLEMRC